MVYLRFLQNRLYKYGREKKLLSPGDQFTVDLIERAKLPLFFFLVFDCLFFSSHSLAHTRFLDSKSAASIASLLMAGGLLVLVVGDITRLLLWNFFLKRPTKADILEQMLVKSVLHAKKRMPATPLSRVINIFQKKHLEAVNRLFIEFDTLVSFRPAEDSFIDNGIRPAVLLDRPSAKYFNLLTFLKTLSMEVVFVTMQANGWVQIATLLSIQSIYSVYLGYCLLKVRIFTSKYYGGMLALHEGCLLAFYTLVAVMEANGSSIYALDGDSSALQQWVVASLALAALVGVVLLLATQIIAVVRRCRGKLSKVEAQEDADNTRLLQDISVKLQKDGYLERLMRRQLPLSGEDLDATIGKDLLENSLGAIEQPPKADEIPEKRPTKIRLPKIPHHLKKRQMMQASTSKVADLRAN